MKLLLPSEGCKQARLCQGVVPAALWEHFSHEVTPILAAQLNLYLVPGAASLPMTWSISDLVLIPKPGKNMKSPGDLRPLAALPSSEGAGVCGCSKTTLQEYAVRYLEDIPQFAYVPARTLAQALERVFSHCAAVRTMLRQGQSTIHAKRQGHKPASVSGGCMLSLDISKAYDSVSRSQAMHKYRHASLNS